MRRAVGTTIALVGALVAWGGSAGAQAVSAGCQFFAAGQPLTELPFTGQFFAGETLTVTATLVPGQPAGELQFFLGGPPPVTGNLNPGNPTVQVVNTVAANAVLTISLNTVPPALQVTGTVTCQAAAAYPLAVSAPHPATDAAIRGPALPSGGSSGSGLGTVALVGGAVVLQAGVWAGILRWRRRPASG